MRPECGGQGFRKTRPISASVLAGILQDLGVSRLIVFNRITFAHGNFRMTRFVLVVGAILGAYIFWPEIQADERLMWAGLIPAAYLAGMWALSDGES